ncbi:unnamed protein product, partial [Pleuronectes platessa]
MPIGGSVSYCNRKWNDFTRLSVDDETEPLLSVTAETPDHGGPEQNGSLKAAVCLAAAAQSSDSPTEGSHKLQLLENLKTSDRRAEGEQEEVFNTEMEGVGVDISQPRQPYTDSSSDLR